MKNYGNKIIAEVGHLLIASNGQRGFALPINDGVTYEEVVIDLSSIETRPFGDVSFGGLINFNINNSTKKNFVNKIWSNDDQIAIILNKDDNEEKMKMFNFMQEWRTWFNLLVDSITSIEK